MGAVRDVIAVSHHQSHRALPPVCYITTSRSGIYDTIPEGVVHRQKSSLEYCTSSDIIAHIRRGRREEEHARTFFLPFDVALGRCRLDLFKDEMEIISLQSGQLRQQLASEWKVFEFLSGKQAKVMMGIIPYISGIRENVPAIEFFLGKLLDATVAVSIENAAPLKLEECPVLGGGVLGLNSILGDSAGPGFRVVSITVTDMRSESPGGVEPRTLDDMLRTFCSYVFSAGTTIRTNLLTRPAAHNRACQEEDRYLNVNSYI